MTNASLAFFFLIASISLYPRPNVPVIVIDPAGNATNIGRMLNEGYERGETYQFAKALQDGLSKRYKVRPVLSRTLNEKISSHLQIASFSNRIDANLFLRLHLYKQLSPKPTVHLFHRVIDPVVDFTRRIIQGTLSFVPLQFSHCVNISKANMYGEMISEKLNLALYNKYLDCLPLCGVPLRFFEGVLAPALVIEVGIHDDKQWRNLVEPLIDSMNFLG